MERLNSTDRTNLMLEHRKRQWIKEGFLKQEMPEKSELYKEWEKYFEIYNEDPNNQKISMSCSPCYEKVYNYVLV